MSFVVQNDDGDVAGANAYITIEEFAAYHSDRGNDIGTFSSTDQRQAIVRATDYLDSRFRFRGYKLNGNKQSTAWPRYDAYDNDKESVYGVPQAVKDATAEYAVRALPLTNLNPDPVRDDSGRRLQSFSTNVAGAIVESATYADAGKVELPEYPAADLKLLRAGLVASPSRSGSVRRA